MKKIKKYVLLFAGLVIAFTGFTACASDGEESLEPDNPETLGEAIKAQFTISIPMNTGKATRQTSEAVQSTQNITNFRGINHIKLYPTAVLPGYFDAGTKFIGKNIALSKLLLPAYTEAVTNFMPATVSSGRQGLVSQSNSVLYGDVQLQIGTRTFLFYGKAIGFEKSTSSPFWTTKGGNEDLDQYTEVDKFTNGMLEVSGLTDTDNPTDVSEFKFSPMPITTAARSNTKRSSIIAYLQTIAESEVTVGETTEKWSTTDNAGLKQLYLDFTGITSSTNYLMAGSSKSLEAAIEDLYFTLINNTNPLAQAICRNICSGTPNEETGVSEDTNVKVTNKGDTKTLVFQDALSGYPSESDNIPDGAAVITWSGTVPSYAIAEGYSEGYVSTDMNVTAIDMYAYPACLYYWGKSGILTSQTSKQELFDGSKTWAQIATDANYEEGNAITSKTRSVVLETPVNYAVGRLDINVVYPSGATSFPDNGTGKDAHNVPVGDIKLTGIIIGGQKPVDWKFEPMQSTSTTTVPIYTIYDDITKSTANSEGIAVGSTLDKYVNSTLVLESEGKNGDVEDKVNVALEFVNNGDDFFGANKGLIPHGTKFYLVCSLDAGDYTSSQGYTDTGGKVFKQDFVTKAQFTIAKLKSAYNTIPDLRNPAVELGLSVDLEWQKGIEFQHTFN